MDIYNDLETETVYLQTEGDFWYIIDKQSDEVIEVVKTLDEAFEFVSSRGL